MTLSLSKEIWQPQSPPAWRPVWADCQWAEVQLNFMLLFLDPSFIMKQTVITLIHNTQVQ